MALPGKNKKNFDRWAGLRTATVDPIQTAAVEPAPVSAQVASPADPYGYVQPPTDTSGFGGFMNQLKYINQVNPGAFTQLGAGIMANDVAGGISHAGQELQEGQVLQQRAKEKLYGYQEEQKNKNLTRQWLLSQGFDEATADAAMSNPDILSSLLKRAEGGNPQNKFAPVLMQRPDGSFYYASPNPETGQLDPYTMATGDVPVDPGSKAGMIEAAKVTGKGSAEARLMLVDAKMQQQDVRVMSQSVLDDPYLDKMFGEIKVGDVNLTGGWFSKADLPNLSPDSSRVMGKLKRLMGQSFLQARQLLKGGGAITDYEGNKADQAYSTIAYAKTIPDLKAAIQEFQYWVDRGVQKLQAQANVENTPEAGNVPEEPAVAPPSLQQPDVTDEGGDREGDTATGPNGEKMVYRNGTWVPQ